MARLLDNQPRNQAHDDQIWNCWVRMLHISSSVDEPARAGCRAESRDWSRASATGDSMKSLLYLCMIMSIAMPTFATDGRVPVAGKPRQQPVRQIVVHATGGPDCDASRSFRGGTLTGIVQHFLQNQGRISIHYVIGRDGKIVAMVPESEVAFHVRGHNQDSIGIELVNDGDGRDPFADAQIAALIDLLRGLLARHGLTIDAIKSHDELDDSTIVCDGVTIKRKQDPGLAFPWPRVLSALDTRPGR